MHRFYVEPSAIANGAATIAGEDFAHLSRVLRLRAGDAIEICDGENGAYDAVISSVDKAEAIATLGERREMDTEPKTKITLYQALPKAGKLDLIVQKCTEIGVSSFVLFTSEFCVAKPDDGKKLDRYRRIAYEAAKQSGRGRIPELSGTLTFKQLCGQVKKHELALLAWEKEDAHSLKAALTEHAAARDIALIVGSEGGISTAEADALQSVGVCCVTLGPRILRTETAGMAMAAMALYQTGDME